MPAPRAASSLFGSYGNVRLTDDELAKLKADFPSDYAERIERLSEYIASTGKRYKSHLATIRTWARRERQSGKLRPVPTAADYHTDAGEAL